MSDLDARYGRRTRPRWVWWIVAAVGIGAGVAWAAWVAFQPRPVTAVLHSYDVTADDSVTVTLDLRRPEPVEIECSVYAQAADHSIVGERTVTIAASDEVRTREAIMVKTQQRAVTAVLRSCQVAE